VELKGDFAYCKSHDFIFNPEAESEKMYNAKPCFFTDSRYVEGRHNYYMNTHLHWLRFTDISLKSCIRKVLKCRNIPVGTVVKFAKSWYYPKKKIDNSFLFKVRKENKFDPKYEINVPQFFANFSDCEFSKQLTDELRKNGFIVRVDANHNHLMGMISTAAQYTTGKSDIDTSEKGETAVAYGHGMIVGFSSGIDSFRGYSNGCDNVLWDKFGEFNKWSRCYEIPKSDGVQTIIDKILTHAHT